jgi:hypothetical protein
VVAERVTDQVQVQPAGGWDDHQHIADPGADCERLEYVGGVDA